MNSETNNTPGDELIALATRIGEYQRIHKLTDNALLRRFTGLGSTKTYKAILEGRLGEYDIERQLSNYRSVWHLIESLGAGERENEPVLDDLGSIIELRRAVMETMRERGNARVIVVLGDSGTGKTTAGRSLMQRYGTRILWCESSVVWGDSPMVMCEALLRALGIHDMPASLVQRMAALVARMQTRVCTIIDEAHHMGPKCLNLLKTLVNQTPGEFVLLAMPTLWRRIESQAYEEVRQLTGNRLAEKIGLTLKEGDVLKLLNRRCPGMNGEGKKAAKLLVERAGPRGNLAFVRNAMRRAVELAEGEQVTLEHIVAAVEAEQASR